MRKPLVFHKTCVLVLLCLAVLLSGGAFAHAAAFPPKKDHGTGMVRSSHPAADAIGQSILDKGGNAVDAAVAVAYALAVAHPEAGNIGGGGFAMIRLADGTITALDFREKAPKDITREMFVDSEGNVIPDATTLGYLAAAVPGTVAGMSTMLEEYGTMELDELLSPSISLATTGIHINRRQERAMAEAAPRFAKFDSSKKIFLKQDGSSYKQGELFFQRDLAKTLTLIAQQGPEAFYEGEIASMIISSMRANGSPIRRRDLAEYAPVWREPLKGTYRGYEILSMGPPSSGGVHLIQILNILERANVAEQGFGSSDNIHLMAEAMRYAFADRSEYMGDPDFVSMPEVKLVDKAYAGRIYGAIQAAGGKAVPSEKVRPGQLLKEKANTTHFSVMDKEGNAVAVTYSINGAFGSAAVVEGAGFLLNNQMDDFAFKPNVPNMFGLSGGDRNALAPDKRPLSSMAPTIVLRNGKPFLVVGSPGGPHIISSIVQVISNMIDHGMSISEAVAAPRIHMQWMPDELRMEKYAVARDGEKALVQMGYALATGEPMGEVNAIHVNQEDGRLYGADDPRGRY